ncbi:hypothetical protein SKAU_G00177240 [Synaphobranchus kaupii]|uniref:Uncharacterized protein n=1 Tax=Synaphobranchus kaupii TaxID=118154 RepID=A0A9Q1IZ63_SYNKA|nr:hypothetical protein SKAU_G00177240 [Synaphobranchus kaupii]
MEIFQSMCRSKARSIIQDSSHPRHELSGHRYRSIQTRSSRPCYRQHCCFIRASVSASDTGLAPQLAPALECPGFTDVTHR